MILRKSFNANDLIFQTVEDGPDVIRVVERQIAQHTPFQVYAKALQELFKSHELPPEAWEQNESKMYPILDQYRKEAYHSLLKISHQHKGAFLCDGVGLGKTFVGKGGSRAPGN